MSVHDPIADALTIIRNGTRAQKESVLINYSKKILGIVKILHDEGYISGYKTVDVKKKNFQKIQVDLKYDGMKSVIENLKRVSKPGLRIYKSVDTMPRVFNGLGVAIVSTPNGVITDREAREVNAGGEVLCYVW